MEELETVNDVVVVRHPETGKPSVAETHYRELEVETETEKLSSLEAQLANATANRENAETEEQRLESALREQKSLVAGVNDILTGFEAGLDDGTVGGSGEMADGEPQFSTI